MIIDQEKVFEEAIRFGGELFNKKSFLEFCLAHIKLVTNGYSIPFSLEGHEPLRELYSIPEHPKVTVIKAAQLGVSTWDILRSFYLCYKYNMRIGYYLPTDDDVNDFVDSKVEPLIDASEYLKKQMGDTDNKMLKQIGSSFLFFRGVYTKRRVKMIDLDYIIKDEVDEAKQENLKFAEDRLLHSKFGWISELSQPSVEGFGIDQSFENSDKSYWGIKCQQCSTYVFPDKVFPECIITIGKNTYLGCPKCTKKLNKNKGKWIAEHPSRSKDKRGFQMSHLVFDFISAKEIKRRFEALENYIEKKNFYISILGRPYSNSKSKPLTDAVLKNAERDYELYPTCNYSFFGMDVGDMCHLVFGHFSDLNTLRVHYFREISSDKEREIIQLLMQQNILFGVIDAMPYKAFAKRIARYFSGRIAINYYKGEELKSLTEGDVLKSTVNREESLDNLVDAVQNKAVELPSSKRMSDLDNQEYENFKSQLKMLIKEPVEKTNGEIQYQYKKRVNNHYGMALNYMRIASQLAPVNVYPTSEPIYL